MVEEFVLLPEVFENLDRPEHCSLVFKCLDEILKNGQCANLYNGYWSQYIKKHHLTKLDGNDRIILQKKLHKLVKRRLLVCHASSIPNHPNSNKEWLNILEQTHKTHPFYGMIANKAFGYSSNEVDQRIWLKDIKQYMYSDEFNDRTTGETLRGGSDFEKRLQEILKPALINAKLIKVIDPYINPIDESKWLPILRVCSRIPERILDSPPKCIEIHCSTKFFNGVETVEFEASWKNRFTQLRNSIKPHSYSVNVWDMGRTEVMHDRYIFTNQFGLSIPGGLDNVKSRKTTVNLLDHRLYSNTYYDYFENSSPYSLVHRYDFS